MRLASKNPANFALIITVLVFLVLGCDAYVNLRGKISDENDSPVNEAKIIVEQGASKVIEAKSGKDGLYNVFENIAPAPFSFSSVKIIVSKEGFQTYEKTISQEELKLGEINVVLKKN